MSKQNMEQTRMFEGRKPVEGEPVQFLGIYALKWPWNSQVEPTMTFNEMGAEWDKVLEKLEQLYDDFFEYGCGSLQVRESLQNLIEAYYEWLNR